MKNTNLKRWATYACMMISLATYAQKNVATGSLHVIPQPREITEAASEKPFVINSSTRICYPKGNEKLERTARFLASYIFETTGIQLSTTTKTGKNSIELQLDPAISQKEGYQLQVTSKRITVKGSTEAGIFYGIQTIHKALPITKGMNTLAALPAGTVNDYPRFDYRGFMVDVGRHFFSVDYLKEMIDMLALHNVNYFHWHLTEDQGWRIEIKKYPQLTKVGSYRKETIVKYGTNDFDGIPVSGFYTQEEAREIVRYAAERFITVIPEIDLPGHSLSALASYPELGCTGGPYEVPTQFGVFADVLCGGNEKSIQFAQDVIEEIMDIFPGQYIHIGGDECPKSRWKACPKCQAKIQELGLKDTPQHTKENQLQVYFMSQVEKRINARGRKMMGWDEILEGNPAKSATIMAWTGVKAGIKSAQLQHPTIICPISHLYFSNPGYNRIRGVKSVERVYNFEPVADVLTADEKQNVLGAQGCIWTEWTKDSVKMEWQIMPRLAALCELQWTTPENKDLSKFLQRLPHQLELYTAKGYHYKQDIAEVVIDVKAAAQSGKASISMRTFDDAPIYYTLDSTEPTASSLLYTGAFETENGAVIKAAAIREAQVSAVIEHTVELK